MYDFIHGKVYLFICFFICLLLFSFIFWTNSWLFWGMICLFIDVLSLFSMAFIVSCNTLFYVFIWSFSLEHASNLYIDLSFLLVYLLKGFFCSFMHLFFGMPCIFACQTLNLSCLRLTLFMHFLRLNYLSIYHFFMALRLQCPFISFFVSLFVYFFKSSFVFIFHCFPVFLDLVRYLSMCVLCFLDYFFMF